MNRDILEQFKLVVEQLNQEEALFADLTFGAGGHSFSFLDAFPKARVVAFDQDSDAVSEGEKQIKTRGFESRIELMHTNFENFKQTVSQRGSSKFAGIVMDLGVSSHHFDCDERGFSFRGDGPLDMRMDVRNPMTAEIAVNEGSEDELVEILREYGEERFASTIVRNILAAREKERITTTKQLEEIIFLSYPKKFRHGRTHPATKTFQALRIFVNRELDVLEKVLLELPQFLVQGGVIAVISFHSLEDRIVKHKFRELSRDKKNMLELINKRPILPSEKEVAENKRSRSAKLRMIRKSLESVSKD
jgi:16S rRNA (cytosine1402-N4)-methyltransferase